jgi:uncharacterized membrane protein
MALERSFRNVLAALAVAVCFPGLAADRAGVRREGRLEALQQDVLHHRCRIGVPEEKDVTVEGWLKLRPGECKVAVETPLEPKYHFLYARTSLAHRGGRARMGRPHGAVRRPDWQFHAGKPA